MGQKELEEKNVGKAQERGTFDAESKETVEKVLPQTETAVKKLFEVKSKPWKSDN